MPHQYRLRPQTELNPSVFGDKDDMDRDLGVTLDPVRSFSDHANRIS